MEILKSKEFWMNGILGFLVIVFIDWFGGRGWKLFQGLSFLQTIEGYKIQFAWVAIAFTVAYYNVKKKQEKA